MSSTEQEQLANQYRLQQQLLAAVFVRELLQLIHAVFDVANPGVSWRALRVAVRSLVRERRQRSAELAAPYYNRTRLAERLDPIRSAPPVPLDEERLIKTLDATGIAVFDKAGRLGASPEQARDRMAVTLTGSTSNLVLEGGRSVIEATILEDEDAIGWLRVTDADPCSWCAMLASRGAVYKSAKTAGGDANSRFKGSGEFKFHDHDGCHAIPVYDHDHPFLQRAEDLYDQWQQVTAGESGKNAINAWRRYWDSRPQAESRRSSD